jgi:ABC-type Fe3+-hydroxamate transport system substrate-binding protein
VTAVRVVSLVPSSTETLRAWGVEPIACTRYCEQPDLPTVGGTKNPDLDAIVGLEPDLVVMDTTENTRHDAEVLRGRGVAVLATEIHAVVDVGPELHRLATAVGVDPALADACSPEGTGTGGPPVARWAFVPIWRRPWMTISGRTYASTLLAAIGIGNVYGDAAEWFPTVALDAVADLRPDVVLAPTEPYEFRPPHLVELAAVAPVEVVDGRDLFWWGARTPGALRRLRSQLVP